MREIYTSIDGYSSSRCETRSYKSLSEEFCKWIEETTIRLLKGRLRPERMAGDVLKKVFPLVYEQPFFMIYGRSYFLDFFIPDKNLAVEIDGKCHKKRKEVDLLRDADFKSIGIKTIRIKASDVLNGKTFEILRDRLQKKKKVKKVSKPKPKKPKESNMIKTARKRLKEHDRMKHNAKWI